MRQARAGHAQEGLPQVGGLGQNVPRQSRSRNRCNDGNRGGLQSEDQPITLCATGIDMSNISSMFCSPEQGHRLAELVPKLRSGLAWYVSPSIQKLEPVTSYMTLGNGG